MNKFSKLVLFLSLFLFVILGPAVNGFCGSSIEDLRKSAEKGDAVAQISLGKAYILGEGVPKNIAEGVKWYRKAAEQGNAVAQLRLGAMYRQGRDVPMNPTEAVEWFCKAADQGNSEAMYTLYAAYYYGEGVPKNLSEAAKWARKSAEQGFEESYWIIGKFYAFGEGVPKDEIEALAWFNIAAASGDPWPNALREDYKKRLGQQASLFAQQRSRVILKEIESAKQKSAKTEEPGQRPAQPADGNADLKGSGTGVFVTSGGLILTAAHVVAESGALKVVTKQDLKVARVVKVDAANDLALLICEGSFQSAPVRPSSGIKLGQSVFTIGFPNIGFQGFSPKMTKSEINSLSGLQDDPRHWQISVPVQPGNSGGPLFDEAGNVIGVVLSKLDAMKVAKFTGEMPQNVNYAVKSIYALPLLEPYAASLAPETGGSASPKMLESVVEKVQWAVALILVY